MKIMYALINMKNVKYFNIGDAFLNSCFVWDFNKKSESLGPRSQLLTETGKFGKYICYSMIYFRIDLLQAAG